MNSARIWLNGHLVKPAKAMVSVTDRGFTSGDGIFETIKVTNGRPFALHRHLKRLLHSAEALGIEIPAGLDLRAAVTETIEHNQDHAGKDARLRITVTAGEGIAGPASPDEPRGPTVVITCDPQAPHPRSLKVITVAYVHNERALLTGAKTTSYAENLAILQLARADGADEALLPDSVGRLSEGTTSNVLVAMEGQLLTPSLATGCLPGVTRELILEWGIAVEVDIPMASLAAAEEVLLCSSTRDLLPVSDLDGRTLPAPGPLGGWALARFTDLARQRPDP